MFLRFNRKSAEVALLLTDHEPSLDDAELDHCRDIVPSPTGRSAFGKAPALPTVPHCGVKTTRGDDSHFDPPAIHYGLPAYPQARPRLAAPPPGARWRTGDRCRGWSDPCTILNALQ